MDYAAVGKTLDQVKKNFESGLSKTIKEHLKMHGGIDKLLQIAPQEAWTEFLNASGDGSVKLSFSMVDAHDFAPAVQQAKVGKKTALPFDKIVYVEPEPAHAQ